MKAQLILVGGRASIPNILTILHQRPDTIVAIVSTESKREWPRLEQAIRDLHPNCHVEEATPIDAFDFRQIYDVCEKALMRYPGASWIFNITTGTTIMSIGAYEVSKKYQHTIPIQCWYLNTGQTRVVALPENKSHDESLKAIFQIDVTQYALVYNRHLFSDYLEDERAYAEEQWLPFSCRLGRTPCDAALIRQVMNKIANNRPGKDRDGEDKSKYYRLQGLSNEVYPLLEEAQRLQLVSQLAKDQSHTCFRLSYAQDKFLNGAWLEMYVWDEAKRQRLFDDCQWNYALVDGNSKNELDVAVTFKAQLLIAECKTGDEAFDSDTIYKLDSIANLLGGKFVGRLLVTSLPLPKVHQKFIEQADSRRVVVITAEDLPIVGEKIAEEAVRPRFARI